MTIKRSAEKFKWDYQGSDIASLKESLTNRLIFTVGKDPYTATERDWFHATAYVVRDRLIERWTKTRRRYYARDSKRVYYLSMEFLLGRSLANSLLNLGIFDEMVAALAEFGVDFEAVRNIEADAALGNGGLGRLAVCLMDSMATLALPGFGYGIRYEFGMFRQGIEDGWQVEHPDSWLRYGNPWEFPRPELLYPVKYYGRVVEYPDDDGKMRHHWVDTEEVMAMAYDVPVPGFQTEVVNNLRLWAAKATRDFNLQYFNEGNYIKAVEDKTVSENLSKVLYPSDITELGRELRLKQQYFFVSASLQDILRRFQKHHDSLDEFPEKVAIQLNDTHPAVAIPELLRILVDTERLPWERAWNIVARTFSYSNHTLLPEALETWPLELFGRVLPRHLQLIYEINHRFLRSVMHWRPGDMGILRRLSLIDETDRRLRMAHLAIVGSRKVNGVAAIHTRLLKEKVFADFNAFFPGKFVNVTNGITPRRWLNQANPGLAALITSRIGKGWITHFEDLERLIPLAEDAQFRKEFRRVKTENKRNLAALIASTRGVEVDIDSLFDVQVKRIHEYKRQLLNVLHLVTLYNRVRSGRADDRAKRTVIFAGKAAPSYTMAKLIIKLINDVADIVNNDPAVGGRLKAVFIPNYDVSTAAEIIPAADLSEQISLAGTEASGTGNMKLALNGALTVGTLDGSTIEIRERVGEENIFIFGHTVDEVRALRESGYRPREYLQANSELRQVLEMLATGYFSPDNVSRYHPIVDALTDGGDNYMLLADYASYVAAQEQVDRLFSDQEEWSRRAILNVAQMGPFSSDRTAGQYAELIWGVKPEPERPF